MTTTSELILSSEKEEYNTIETQLEQVEEGEDIPSDQHEDEETNCTLHNSAEIYNLASAGMAANNEQLAAMLAEANRGPSAEELSRYVEAAAQQHGISPPISNQQQLNLHQQHQAHALALYQQQQQAASLAASSVQQTPQPTSQSKQSSSMVMEMEDPEESDEEGNGRAEKRAGRRKIRIEYIEDKSRRHITFSKRKAGIMKKAYELSTLTGTQVLLLVASETGHVYTFATPKLQPLITKPEGKNLIQACLNAPDGAEYGHPHGGYEEDAADERPMPQNQAPVMGGIPQNYAAAMAGLAGYQYPQQSSGNPSNASLQAYMSQAAAAAQHYPSNAYAHQYAAAAAAAYWPQSSQGGMQQGHDRAQGSVVAEAESGDSGEHHG